MDNRASRDRDERAAAEKLTSDKLTVDLLQDIWQCLGKIETRLDDLSKNTNRIMLALIGVITAQIGVKILGTDPLLDIATTIAIIGSVLLLGALLTGLKLSTNLRKNLTSTGKWLAVVIVFLLLTQAAAYFRDLGVINYRVVYVIRIFQNLSMLGFAWSLLKNNRLFKNGEDSDKKKPNR